MKHVYVNFPFTIAKALVSGFLASHLTWSHVGHVVTVCTKFWKYDSWVGFSSIMFVACFVKSISLKVNRRTHTHAHTHHGDLINPLICCKEKIWTENPLFPGSCGFLTFWHRRFTLTSNKSPTWCNSLLSWRLFTAQHVLGVFPPIVRSSTTAVAASGFTFVSWW
jgi:hypothetical protein